MKKTILLCALVLLASPKIFAKPLDLFKTIEGQWYGEGFNINVGEYKAWWNAAFTPASPMNILSGKLKIVPKERPIDEMNYTVTVSQFEHTHGDAIVVTVKDFHSTKTYMSSALEKNRLLAWAVPEVSASATFVSGIRIIIDADGVLSLAFQNSFSYCPSQEKNYQACVSDTFSPFLVKKE